MGNENQAATTIWDTAIMTRACLTAASVTCALMFNPAETASADGGPIAQILCASREEMRQRLETRYRAHRAWAGLRSPDEVMELWEDPEGDWTLVITHADGNWCIVAMGEAYLPFAQRPHG